MIDVVLDAPGAGFGTLLKFWLADGAQFIIWAAIELLLLGIVAVRAACHIATEHGYRLVPLNAGT